MKRLEAEGNELSYKGFAFDGDKSLFTVAALSENKVEFIVSLGIISSRYMHS